MLSIMSGLPLSAPAQYQKLSHRVLQGMIQSRHEKDGDASNRLTRATSWRTEVEVATEVWQFVGAQRSMSRSTSGPRPGRAIRNDNTFYNDS